MLNPCLPGHPLRAAGAALLLALAPIPGGADDRVWPLLHEAAELSVVAEDLRIDGMPMRIRSFRIERPVAAVLHSYRSWAGPARVENRLGGWQLIAHRQDDRLLMLRLRPEGTERSAGTLSEAEIDGATVGQSPLPEGITVPADTRVGTHITMKDEGRESQLVVLANAHPVGLNVRHFRTQLEAHGYRLQHELPAGGPHPGYSLWLAAPGKEAVVIVFAQDRARSGESGTTAITLNVVHHAASAR